MLKYNKSSIELAKKVWNEGENLIKISSKVGGREGEFMKIVRQIGGDEGMHLCVYLSMYLFICLSM
jgi:hypothetical protein